VYRTSGTTFLNASVLNSGTFRDILSLPARTSQDSINEAQDEAIRTLSVTETADKFYEWLHLVHHLSVANTLDRRCHAGATWTENERESEWVTDIGMLVNG
jgi:hypothetical protein